MKKKINYELTPRESRLAEEAVGIKRNSQGRYSRVASYKQDFESQQTATRVCTQKLNQAHKVIERQGDDLVFYKFVAVLFVGLILVAIADILVGPYIDIINDHIINFLTPLYD